MRRLFLILLALFLAAPSYAFNEVSFIYLNGSNTNTEKSKEAFIKGVNNLHFQINNKFENDSFIEKEIFDGKKIADEPIVFYWGDMSKADIEVLDEDFVFLKAISPKPANAVRKFMAQCLHDAIWVTKAENMYPLIQKLHKVVMKEYSKGNQSVLMGYSAGTFIVHQYLIIKSPIIDLYEAIPEEKEFAKYKEYTKAKNINPTCSDALFNSTIATYTINKNFVFEDDFESFKRKVDGLNDLTVELCTPRDALKGGINFASPYVLFYSELFDKNRPVSKLLALSYKFIVENNLFWLTVNYADDPLGFPVSRNAKIEDIEKITKQDIDESFNGFIYDKSDKSSGRTFIMAHLAYFSTSKKYAKILAKAMKEGYDFFHMTYEE